MERAPLHPHPQRILSKVFDGCRDFGYIVVPEMVTAKKKKLSTLKRVVPAGPEFVLDSELVPMPEKVRIGPKKVYFPFDVLEVGRSFTTHRVLGTVRSAIRRFRRDGGQMEKVFMTEEQADGRVRCWRRA